MKILRYALLAVLMIGVSGIARATIIHVLDPSGPENPTYTIVASNASDPIPITFYDCTYVPGDGCFAIFNNTDETITSFTATIPSTVDLGSVMCSTDPVTGGSGTVYTYNFSSYSECDGSNDTLSVGVVGGEGIGPGQTLLLVETGIPDTDFTTPGTANVTLSPEPSSLLLALTGLGPLGYVVRRRLRGLKA